MSVTIEMFWGCEDPFCAAKNLGRFKKCGRCGRPRSEKSPEFMPDQVSLADAVTDPELLRKFDAGEDWKCRFCGSSQFRADGNCAQCGSEQAQTTGNIHGKSDADKACRGELTKADIERMLKGHKNKLPETPQVDLSREEVVRMTSEADPFPPQPPEPPAFVPDTGGYRTAPKRVSVPPVHAVDLDERFPLPRFRPSLGGIAAVAAAVLFGLILFLIFRTKEVNADVVALSWVRTISVERNSAYHHEGWDPSEYGAFDVRNEGRRYHHDEKVSDGFHMEKERCGEEIVSKGSCYTTPLHDCVSQKNGSAKCQGGDRVCTKDVTRPKYCDKKVEDFHMEPRYQDWYSWKVWEWHHNRDVRASGSTTRVHWPTDEQIRMGVGLASGEQERESGRSEVYNVVLAGGGERHTFHPRSEAEFQRFSVGDHHKIKVGIAHGVEILP